ncbi:hypothetical protein VB714_22550 [Spirulina sp. 06S082]|nr:hypothetical protein [Spirulina sp. 06S082]
MKNIIMLKFRIDYTFLGLNVILICLNIVYWLSSTIPLHDGLLTLQSFHVFYRDFLLHGELPAWLPYNFYGLPSDYYLLTFLSPFQYFAFFLGKVFHIKNTYYLFLFSVYLEQLQLLTGSYLLSKKVLHQKISIIFMCAGILLSSFLYIQPFFNFKLFSFFPLVFFLILKFLDNFNFLYLGLTGVILILSLFGNAAFLAPILIYIPLLFLLIVLLKGNYLKLNIAFLKKRLKGLLKPWFVLFCVILLLLALCYLFIASEALNFSVLTAVGRDPSTRKVPLSEFLTYGGSTSILRYLEFIWGIGFSEAVIYVGLIPIVFLIYSVLFVRNTIFYSSLICLLAILAVGLGRQGLIAPIIYHLPLLSYYRHIGLLVPVAKIFLLLCASLGIDHFFESLSTKKRKKNQKTLITCSIIIVFLSSLYFLFEDNPFFLNFPSHALNPYFLNGFAIALLLLFLVVNVYFFHRSSRKIKSILIYSFLILYLLDIFSWHLSYLIFSDSYSPDSVKSFVVENYDLQMKRFETINQLKNSRSLSVFRDIAASKPEFARYGIIYTFADADPCIPIYRQDFWTTFVDDFMKLRLSFQEKQTGKLPENRQGHYGTLFPTYDDSLFYNTIGCTASKIRFGIPSENLRQEFNNDDVTTILQKLDNPNAIIVNEYGNNKPREFLEDINSINDLQNDLLNVKIVDFSLNSLELDIELKKEPTTPLWLIYADAFHPSWQAFVNEKPANIFMANYAFKGIKLTNLKMGVNHVSFHFKHLRKVRVFLTIVLFLVSCCLIMLTFLNIFTFERS